RVSRTTDEKQRLEQRNIIPLHRKLDDRRGRACSLSGQVFRPSFGLNPMAGRIESAAKIPETLALVQVHASQDRSHVRVYGPMVKKGVLVVPDRNPYQRHAITPLRSCVASRLFSAIGRHLATRRAGQLEGILLAPAPYSGYFEREPTCLTNLIF